MPVRRAVPHHHFLGQAERQRFTSRETDDQWAALKGPSGIDRLELVRTRLRGKATTLAFGRRIKAEQAAVAAIEKDIADWQGWQARLERLREAVRAGGGLTEQDVRSRALEIETEASDLLERKPAGIAAETNSQLLARLAVLLQTGSQQLSDRAVALEGAGDLIGRYDPQVALANNDHPTLVRAREQTVGARTASETAEKQASDANNAVTDQTVVVTSIESEISRLEAGREDMLRRDELVGLLAAARQDVETQNGILVEHRRIIAEADLAIQAHGAAAAELKRLQAVADQAQEDVAAASRLTVLAGTAQERANALAFSAHAAANVRAEYDSTIGARDQQMEALENARRERTEAERHAGAIAAAVAALSTHIHEDDELCPVCNAKYPPGQLKLLASEAARSGDARVTQAAAAVEAIEAELAKVGQRIKDLEPVLARPADLELSAQQAAQEANDLRLALAQALDVSPAGADLAAVALSRNESAQTELRAAQSALTTLQPAAAAAQQRRSSSNDELEQFINRANAATERVAEFVAEDQECAERIAARGVPTPTLGEIASLLITRRNELETALTRLAELEDESAHATSSHARLQGQLLNHEGTLSAAQSAAENARLAAAQLVEQWRALELPGVPDRVALDDRQATLSAATSRFGVLSERLQELAKVNQDVLLDEELALVSEQMRSAGGDAVLEDPASHLRQLRARLDPTRAALKLTEDAHGAVDKYTVKLGDRAEAYNREVLEPLNDRILEFNAAMLSTPGASVQFRADKRIDRTDFEMQLRYSDEVDDSIQSARKVPPQVILSEGQLAANGFSILCAASTAYRWSRWRALLLDDPLQHNDIIHTAAFVDVMRNLVELERYQLIMSSHDRAESDFIARKFDAAGLGCTTVLLTAPSESGVAFDPPTYNAVARRALSRASGTAAASSA